MSLPFEYYYDKKGFEIRVGDILKVYHCGGGKRRTYYMWKLVSYSETHGLVGVHTGCSKIAIDELKNSFRLHAIADEKGVLTYAEIINRDICFNDKYATQITPENTLRKRIKL